MKKYTTQEENVIAAVIQAKKSQFKATAIKAELEANLYRNCRIGEFHEQMMECLSELGLAERVNDWEYLAHEEDETDWRPVAPLMYAETYNDGSVDTEFTYTLSLDNPENILLEPKIIDIWNRVCQDNGDEFDVCGAGMHTAWLNSSDCSYPTRNDSADSERYQNFRDSMTLLLPALYFLGASGPDTRGLVYRRPEVGYNTHRAAIDWRGGALEFRIFDTCYETPSQFLDNVIVMSKCLRYWSDKRVDSGASKITTGCSFGPDNEESIGQFYTSVNHIDLLNHGLARLKPDYLSVRQIKEKRLFKKTRATVAREEKQAEKTFSNEFGEYEERFEWRVKASEAERRAYYYSQLAEGMHLSPEQIEESVQQVVKATKEHKQDLETYVQERLNTWKRRRSGNYSLTA